MRGASQFSTVVAVRYCATVKQMQEYGHRRLDRGEDAVPAKLLDPCEACGVMHASLIIDNDGLGIRKSVD